MIERERECGVRIVVKFVVEFQTEWTTKHSVLTETSNITVVKFFTANK